MSTSTHPSPYLAIQKYPLSHVHHPGPPPCSQLDPFPNAPHILLPTHLILQCLKWSLAQEA